VPSPPNAAVLLDAAPQYAMVIGAYPDRPPATDRPLVGLVALNYVGASAVHGALFFDCLDRVDSAGPTSAPAGWRMP